MGMALTHPHAHSHNGSASYRTARQRLPNLRRESPSNHYILDAGGGGDRVGVEWEWDQMMYAASMPMYTSFCAGGEASEFEE